MNASKVNEFRVPILTYHSIDDSGSIISTSPGKFRSQMQHLKNTSSNVISLNDIVNYLRHNQPFPPKSIALTFDDGFRNFYQIAYPILREFGFGATVFLVPEHCGKNNQWAGQPRGIPKLDLLQWNEVKEMAEDGIDFGAHTMSHPDLSLLSPDEIKNEITASKQAIQDRLGREVLFFAYPYGKLNRHTKRIVEDEFYGACVTELGFADLKSDIYSLPRIDMFYFSQNNLFSWYGKSIFSLYLSMRSALRSFRIRCQRG